LILILVVLSVILISGCIEQVEETPEKAPIEGEKLQEQINLHPTKLTTEDIKANESYFSCNSDADLAIMLVILGIIYGLLRWK